jgi:hypothetical protein
MRQYKIITLILLILPIINFAFALPVAVQETREVCGDAVPEVAITMSAKRGEEDMYFERLSGKPGSDLAGLRALQPEAPDHGSMDPPQTGTSEIQQVSPGLSKSPSEASLDHYLASPGSEASLDHYLASPGSEASLNHYLASPESEASFGSADDSLVSTDPESGPSRSAATPPARGSGQSKMKSFLRKVVASKLKFWRRISGPVSVRDAVNVAQRQLQGLVDTGAYVSASSPESQTF